MGCNTTNMLSALAQDPSMRCLELPNNVNSSTAGKLHGFKYFSDGWFSDSHDPRSLICTPGASRVRFEAHDASLTRVTTMMGQIKQNGTLDEFSLGEGLDMFAFAREGEWTVRQILDEQYELVEKSKGDGRLLVFALMMLVAWYWKPHFFQVNTGSNVVAYCVPPLLFLIRVYVLFFAYLGVSDYMLK